METENNLRKPAGKQEQGTFSGRFCGAGASDDFEWEAGLQDPLFLEAEQERLREDFGGRGKEVLPVFPAKVYRELPPVLEKAVKHAKSDRERDAMLLAAMASLSCALPRVQGKYHGKTVYPNLYLFVTAPASAGKGRLAKCVELVMPIHREIRQESEKEQLEFQAQVAEQESRKAPRTPLKQPGQRMLVIPANNSTTGFIEQLGNNGGRGLIFETEADTLSKAFRTDYGAYGESLRKAFHNEDISYNRRTEKEYVRVEKPALSVFLSGTPGQVRNLFEDAEDGLFSRFLFYHMDLEDKWEDVFEETEDLEAYFRKLGEDFLVVHRQLERRGEALKLEMSRKQQADFNSFFARVHKVYGTVKNKAFVASVRRVANSCYRMMLLLASLRLREVECEQGVMQLKDADFLRVLEMAEVMLKHASYIFTALPEVKEAVMKSKRKESFWNALPQQFDTRTYHKIAKDKGIPISTADKYVLYHFVPAGILVRMRHGIYEKLPLRV